jgi:hypothetical protein
VWQIIIWKKNNQVNSRENELNSRRNGLEGLKDNEGRSAETIIQSKLFK